MNITDILYAKKLSGGGGGGGSSDFSVAEVTIQSSAVRDIDFMYPSPLEANEFDDNCPAVACAYGDYVQYGITKTIKVVLYKGAALFMFTSPSDATLSGDCEWLYEDDHITLLITGDCTIECH